MSHIKVIKKRGKTYGPYLYESYRDNYGNVKKRYLGKATNPKKLLLPIVSTIVFLFAIATLFCYSTDFFSPREISFSEVTGFYTHFVGQTLEKAQNSVESAESLLSSIYDKSISFISSVLSPSFTGNVNLNIHDSYSSGELLQGSLELKVKSGELIPADTKIIVEQQEINEFLFSDFISSNSNGNYFAEGKELQGEGDGFGFSGEKIIYPEILFTLNIKNSEKDAGGGIGPSTPPADIIEIPEEEQEIPVEEVPAEEITIETPTENTEEEIIVEEPAEKEETPVEEPQEEQKEEVQEEIQQEIPITGQAILKETEIAGKVSKNNNFEYNLQENEIVNIKSNSVFSGEKELSSGVLNLVQEEGKAIVSTEYEDKENGFGQEYLTDEEHLLDINLENLNIPAEDGILTIKLVYEGVVLAEISKEISVSGEISIPEEDISENLTIPEENLTEINETIEIPENFTEENVTLIENITNETLIEENLTEINETIPILEENFTLDENKTKQYKAIINLPVKWIKQVNLSEETLIELPKDAENITIKTGEEIEEALQEIEDYENTIDNIDRSDLLTGQVVGDVSLNIKNEKGFVLRFIDWIKSFTLTGNAIAETEFQDKITETDKGKIVDLKDITKEEQVAIEYYTPAPLSEEIENENSKIVIISASDEYNYTDILAYTELPNVGFVQVYHYVYKEVQEEPQEEFLEENLTENITIPEENLTEINETIIEPPVEEINDTILVENETEEIVNETLEENNTIIIEEPVLEENVSEILLTGEVIEEINLEENFTEENLTEEIPLEEVIEEEIVEENLSDNIKLVKEEVEIETFDLDNDGFIDYVEWIVPHLSNQTYEFSYTNESLLNEGTFNYTFWNDSTENGFIQLEHNDSLQELPNGQANDGYIDMQGNVLLYHFNNNSDLSENDTYVADLSLNENNGIVNGTVYWNSSGGKLNGAFEFDNVNDCINIPDSSALKPVDNFTITAWIKVPAIQATYASIFESFNYATLDAGIRFEVRAGNSIGFHTCNATSRCDSTPAVTSSTTLQQNNWYFVVALANDTGRYVYINNYLDGSNTSGYYPAGYLATNFVHVGCIEYATSKIYYFNGSIDELTLWNRSLSEEEILNMYDRQKGTYINLGEYTSNVTLLSYNNDLVNLSWRTSGYGELANNQLDEVNAGTFMTNNVNMTDNVLLYHFSNNSDYGENETYATDYSFNENNGTVNGSIWNSSGKYGGAFEFDGVNDCINIPDSSALKPVDNFTITAWIKVPAIQATHTSIFESFNYATLDAGIRFEVRAGNSIGFHTCNATSRCDSTPAVNGSTNLETDTWYFVVALANDTGRYVYLNDNLDGSNTSGYYPAGYLATNFVHVGCIEYATTKAQYFNGSIDEVAIWNRTLSEEEISEVYRRGATKFNLTYRACDDSACDGEEWILVNGTSPQLLNFGNTNSYFQYSAAFEGSDYTPELYNVTLQSAEGNLNISFVDPTPENGTSTSESYEEINVTIEEDDLQEVLFSWNDTNYTMYNDSLVLMMNFDNVSSLGEDDDFVADLSPWQNNGIVTEAAWNSTGKYGGAYDFDGVNDFVYILDPIITKTDAATISAWIYLDGWGEGGFGAIFTDNTVSFATTNAKLAFSSDGASTLVYSAADSLSLSTWAYVTATRTDAGVCNLYVNGVLSGSADQNSGTPTDAWEGSAIGDYGAAGSYTFDGLIDELRIWNVTLSEEEIYQQYQSNLYKYDVNKWSLYINQSIDAGLTHTYYASATAGGYTNSTEVRTLGGGVNIPEVNFTEPTPDNGTSTENTYVEINVSIDEGSNVLEEINFNWNDTNYTMYNNSLVLMMNFDNVSALGENDTYVKDLSLYGNNGTVYGTVPNETGKYGFAYGFDSTTDYIIISDSNSLDFGSSISFSIGAWVKLSSTGNYQQIVGKYNTSGQYYPYYWLDIDNNNLPTFRIGANSTSQPSITYSSSITDNTWHYLVGVRDISNNKLYLYVDGVQINNTEDTAGIDSLSNEGNVLIGMDSLGNNYFTNGTIDEVRIWNISLSEEEILQQYYSNLYKYDVTNWTLYVNQTNLSDGDHTYFASAKDVLGFENMTEERTLTISTPSLLDSCFNMSSAGSYELGAPISNAGESCMIITSSDVELDCSNNQIDGATLGYGIYADGADTGYLSNITIINCPINNFSSGIYFEYVNNSYIENSTTSYADDNGIYLYYSGNNTIVNFETDYDVGKGYYLYYSDANTLNNITAEGCDDGLNFYTSNYNSFVNSTLTNNLGRGVYLYSSRYNNFTQGISDSGLQGINLYYSNQYNIFTVFNITNNSLAGINISEETDDYNQFYNNLINGTDNLLHVLGATNYYNTSNYSGTNIIGGSYVAGNYWADYSGPDTDLNGIGDIGIRRYDENEDFLPLVNENNISNVSYCGTVNYEGIFEVIFDVNDTNSTCFTIPVSNVEIDCNFNQIDGIDEGYGIYAYYQLFNITIRSCPIQNFSTGIYLDNVNGSYIYDTNIIYPLVDGILLNYSSNNTINNTRVEFATDYGFRLENVTDSFFDNISVDSSGDGIYLTASSYNNFYNLTSTNAVGSSNTDLRGIYLTLNSQYNNFTQGITDSNKFGFLLDTNSSYNQISQFNFTNSSDTGINLTGYDNLDNLIFDNYFENTLNAWIEGGNGQYWNTTYTTATNILGNVTIGGNYWNDYISSDTDYDGIGDSAYLISANETDFLPLTNAGYSSVQIVNFTGPTPDDNSFVESSSIEVNVSIDEGEYILSEVKFNFNNTNYTIYDNNLIAMYNFDNIANLGENDTYILDVTNNGNNATYYHSGNSGTSIGKYGGGGWYFDAAGYIDLGNNITEDILSTGQNMTISLWFMTWNDSYATHILWEGEAAGNGYGGEEELHISFGRLDTSDDYLTFYWGDSDDNATGGDPVSVSYSFTETGVWHHVAIVVDPTVNSETAYMYLDGEYVAQDSGSIASPFGDWLNTRIARPGADERYLDGRVDELRIWNKSLSAEEIRESYKYSLNKYDITNWTLYVNQTLLTLGNSYNYFASAKDINGVENLTETRTITYTDTTVPYFNEDYFDLEIFDNSSAYQQFNATDDNAVQCFDVNDTTYFSVDCNGNLTNATTLLPYEYYLNITVNDTIGNTNSTIMYVNVTSYLISNIQDCITIATGGVYLVTGSFVNWTAGNTACFNISASNVELDCQGNSIDINSTTHLVNFDSASLSNITIENCIFNNIYSSNYPNFLNAPAGDPTNSLLSNITLYNLFNFYGLQSNNFSIDGLYIYNITGVPFHLCSSQWVNSYVNDLYVNSITSSNSILFCGKNNTYTNILIESSAGNPVAVTIGGTGSTSSANNLTFINITITKSSYGAVLLNDINESRFEDITIENWTTYAIGSSSVAPPQYNLDLLTFTNLILMGYNSVATTTGINIFSTATYMSNITVRDSILYVPSGNHTSIANASLTYINVTMTGNSSLIPYIQFWDNYTWNNKYYLQIKVTNATGDIDSNWNVTLYDNNNNYYSNYTTDGSGLTPVIYIDEFTENFSIPDNTTATTYYSNYTFVASNGNSMGIISYNVSLEQNNVSVVIVESEDLIPPYFLEDTDTYNLEIYENQSVNQDFNATDNNLFENYAVNDTVNFNIDSTGLLTNLTALNINLYYINISINDSFGNSNETMIYVNVSPMFISPNINFTEPTPEDGITTTNSSVEINVSIDEGDYLLQEVKFNWNDTNYTMYNGSLVLMMNFDNVSSLGENDTYVVDLSQWGNNGTCGNVSTATKPTWNSSGGKYGGAFEFDGVTANNNVIRVVNNTDLDLISGFTLCSWIYLKSAALDLAPVIMTKSQETSSGGGWEIGVVDDVGVQNGNTGDIFVLLLDGAAPSPEFTTSTTPISYNNWYHVCSTWNGSTSSGSVKVYVNGNLQEGNELNYGTTPAANNFEVTIGATQDSRGQWNGTIDEVRIWNVSLSAEEIYQQYQSNLYKYDTTNWTLYVNQTLLTSGNSYTYFASAKDTNGNENITETRTITYQSANTAPENPTVEINSSLGTNKTLQDLSCYATLADPDENMMNVSVEWYNDSILAVSQDYNDSYTNGSVFIATLANENTTRGENWSCGLRIDDGELYTEFINSTTLYIENSLPVVTLTDPATENVTTNRTPGFSWTAVDDDNDDLTYEINITAYPTGSDDNRYVTGISETSYTAYLMKYLSDNNYYYNWTVRANDGTSGEFADERIINISSSLTISMPVDSVNFYAISHLKENDTTTNEPAPFQIQNDGNALLNVSISADDLWATEANPNDYYKFKIDNVTGEEGAFEWLSALVDWTQMPTAAVVGIPELNYTDEKDVAEMDIYIKAPENEPPAVRNSTVTFTSSLAE